MATNIQNKINENSTKKKLNIEQLRARDNEMVKGRFHFLEVPTGTLSFSYCKYKKDPILHFDLKDGETYTIPRGVAKHLVNIGQYPVHEYQKDTNGSPVVRIGRKKRRYSFESLDFFSDEELQSKDSNIFTVERVSPLKI